MTKLVALKLRERGNTPRGMKKAFNAASKAAWYQVALYFHRNLMEKRFSPEHAREAGYAHRKGELLPRGSKAFQKSYTGRKLRMYHHMNPLQFTGDTRAAVKRAVSIDSTAKGGKAAYRGASKFSFRHPKSKIRMSEEFQRITAREAVELGEYYDQQLDLKLAEQDK